MKILFDVSTPFMLAHGGAQIQIEQTRAALESIGGPVENLRWWDDAQTGDILHYMGRPPAGLSIAHGALSSGVPPIPVRLPSSLLERRPDVAVAEETMRQANAEIGVAFAGYFPAISLSGLFGYSGNPFLAHLGPSNPVWSFGASLAQPVFNGGLTGAQVEAAREAYQSDVATYRQTVLTAIQQVEDNLAGIRILSREAKVQEEDVRISRQATQIALNEYRAGTQSFVTVVTAQEQQLAAEESQLSTQAQIQTDAVSLIVALGGGWSRSKLPDAAAESAALNLAQGSQR